MIKPLHILLIEDNDDDDALIRRALRRGRFEIERVSQLSEALEALTKTAFDVVLLDLTLPDSTGFETFAKVRPRAGRAAIIVCTGLDDEELGLRTVQQGAQDYVPKGCSAPELERAIRYAYERKQTEEVAARYAAELRERNAELQDDLLLAREVQESFLPDTRTIQASIHEGGGLRFCHRYLPAGAVGGDFFSLVPVSESEVGILLADVMGHGVRAALVTAMLRALVGERSNFASDPARMLTELNRALGGILRQADSTMFVTAFYLVADGHSGEIRFASAGHPSPLLLHADGRLAEPLTATPSSLGPALGLVDAPPYPYSCRSLDRGDWLLLFTDGAYEVVGVGGETYGDTRFLETALGKASLGPDDFLDQLVADLLSYSASGNFDDDVCLITLDLVPRVAKHHRRSLVSFPEGHWEPSPLDALVAAAPLHRFQK